MVVIGELPIPPADQRVAQSRIVGVGRSCMHLAIERTNRSSDDYARQRSPCRYQVCVAVVIIVFKGAKLVCCAGTESASFVAEEICQRLSSRRIPVGT